MYALVHWVARVRTFLVIHLNITVLQTFVNNEKRTQMSAFYLNKTKFLFSVMETGIYLALNLWQAVLFFAVRN